MFRVDYRFNGFALWSLSGAPVTVQAAWGLARAMSAPTRSDQVRIVPAGTTPRLLDTKA